MFSTGGPPTSPSAQPLPSDAVTAVRKFTRCLKTPFIPPWMTVIVAGLILWNVTSLIGVDAQKNQRPPVTGVPVKFHEDHRTIQWCVNGLDEPEFHIYPWSDFVPVLRRKYHENFKANVRYFYTVNLWPIKIDVAESANYAPGSGGNLLQRAHFVFHVKLRKEFETGVNLDYYNTSVIEGLLVQANFAPHGIGLPFGQFIHPKSFNCVDCKKPVGIPIACRRRTHLHIVHPTVMAYHYKMKIPKEDGERKAKYCSDKFTPSQCILVGFKLNDDTLAVTQPPAGSPAAYTYNWEQDYKQYLDYPLPGMAQECTKTDECEDKVKEWYKADCCLNSENGLCNNTDATGATNAVKKSCPNKNAPADAEIYENPWDMSTDKPIMECKPFEINVCRPTDFKKSPRYDRLWEDLQINYKKDPKEEYAKPASPQSPPTFNPFDPNKNEQCCFGAPGDPPNNQCPPAPTGTPRQPTDRCPKEDKANNVARTECVSRVVLPVDQDEEPWAENFPAWEESQNCNPSKLDDDEYGVSNEVHGNFVWFLPPCRGSSVRVRFRFLVVHSFRRGQYSIQESDYFDLKAGASANDEKLNHHIPTPLFSGFPHLCETSVTGPQYLYTTAPADDQPTFDSSRSYDACVQNVTGVHYVNDQVCPGIPKFTPAMGKKKRGRKQKPQKAASNFLIPRCDINNLPSNEVPSCEYECPKLPGTTPEYVSMSSTRIIKRTLHGGINIVTNFCVMPICVFIARFYKETYNLQSFKGQKTWYWMHMIGAGGSTLFMYMGYFTDKLVDNADAHLVYGNIYIICLGLSYMASWMRHKNRWVSMIVESIHSVCGYSCFILALICVTNAKHDGEYISPEVKYVVYVAIASLTVFYLGMTLHICSLDKKFGMKPKRWHFPSVESRFDDLPVPGRNVRKIFIFAVLFINLPLTLTTLFI